MNRDLEIDGTMDLGKRSPLELTGKRIDESKLKDIIRECLIGLFESVDEKAKSKAQQRFMGMVHAVQKGNLDPDDVGSSVAKAAKTMKKKDVKDFAETKHKGLPNHVDESTFQDLNDMDNYSGEYSRVDRYDIYIDGQLEYHDVPEEAVDRICASWERKPYDVDIDVKRLNESCDGEHPYCGEKKDMEDAEKSSPDKPMDFNKKQKGISINENDLISLIKESVQEVLVNVLAKYVKGEATAEEANKAIMNLANSSNMKLNENEFDELNISTMRNAYDKMQRNGQYDRSSKLATRSWKMIYNSLADNLVIYKSLWGINVGDPHWSKYNYTFDINTCQWSSEPPRFVDRKAAVILANLIRQECGERAGDFGNKAMYIK